MKRSYKTVAVILLIVLLASIGLFLERYHKKSKYVEKNEIHGIYY